MYKATAQAIAKAFGIKNDYTHAGDGARYANNGEDCSRSNGAMGNIQQIKKVQKWTQCSLEDLRKYIQNHGGNSFCLHSSELIRVSQCAGRKVTVQRNLKYSDPNIIVQVMIQLEH